MMPLQHGSNEALQADGMSHRDPQARRELGSSRCPDGRR
jgi:hypothetical protein